MSNAYKYVSVKSICFSQFDMNLLAWDINSLLIESRMYFCFGI